MDAQDLNKLLEKADDKLSIFADSEILNRYEFNLVELITLIDIFLSNEEKLKLFDYTHFQQLSSSTKAVILSVISDENILLKVLHNNIITNNFENYEIVHIIENMSDTSKKQLLNDQTFIEKHQLPNYELEHIVSSLNDSTKLEVLMDLNLTTNILHLANYQITNLIKELSSDEDKSKVLEIYPFENYDKVNILMAFSNNNKLDILLTEKGFNKYNKLDLLQTFDIKTLLKFFAEHKEFCYENNIHPYEIIYYLNTEMQKDFITNLDNCNLTLSEKREILATLKEETKQSIDTSNFSEEYKTALSMKTNNSTTRIILDLERNLKDYEGLDNLLSINAEEFTENERAKFLKLCDICPDLEVISTLNHSVQYISTTSEYKEAEEWISSIVQKLKPEYSKAQKMAIIDNAIGKKISYSPDFDTEVFNKSDCRTLWKIISSGYGVCNGIAKVEQYIFNRIGIESEFVSSENHAFLKIKNIELPLANGEVVTGNTILDPTWNLTSHRFNGKPNNFCISYEQARKSDIDINGVDHNCHKNDEELQDATLSLDELSLRNLFTSVGLADKYGNFPIKSLIEQSKLLDTFYANQIEHNINTQFLLLKQTCPEFATCQNSSMTILSGILLDNENLKFNKCVVNRVYNRNDEEKKPVLFTYIDSDELGKKFYFASKEEGQFIELPQEEFINKFECYEEDLKITNGIRPWETSEQIKGNTDLSRDSGKIVAQEEEER